MDTNLITTTAIETVSGNSFFNNILAVFLLLPIVWYLGKKMLEMIMQKMDEIRMAVGKTNLTTDQALDIVAAKMWYASIKKLDFIKQELTNNDIVRRKVALKKNIRTTFEAYTREYIDDFNQFNVSNVVKLGEYIWEHFPMDIFMEEVYNDVFAVCGQGEEKKCQNTTVCIDRKIKDVGETMKRYQLDFINNNLKKALGNN